MGGINLNKKTTMKNDKVIDLLPAVIVLGGVTYLASTHLKASHFSEAAMVTGLIAVVVLLALAAIDYRGKTNSYAER